MVVGSSRREVAVSDTSMRLFFKEAASVVAIRRETGSISPASHQASGKREARRLPGVMQEKREKNLRQLHYFRSVMLPRKKREREGERRRECERRMRKALDRPAFAVTRTGNGE